MTLRNIITASMSSFNYVSASQTRDPSTSACYNSLSSGSLSTILLPDYIMNTSSWSYMNVMTGSSAYITGVLLPDYILNTSDFFNVQSMIVDSIGYFSVTGSIPSSGSSGTSNATRYKMRGYRIATHAFEYWIATDPNSPPPSGNTLIDITIAMVLTNT